MTSLKPKHLNFDEMWKLYKLLQNGIENRNEETYLIDEMLKILDKISSKEYIGSLDLLYDKKIYTGLNAVTSIQYLVDGLKANKFFEFCFYIRGMNGSS